MLKFLAAAVWICAATLGAVFYSFQAAGSHGDDAKPKKFLGEIGVKDLKLYREPTLKLFDTVKKRGLALGLPVTMLVDGEGCLIGHMNGPAEWSSPDAKRLIEAAQAS